MINLDSGIQKLHYLNSKVSKKASINKTSSLFNIDITCRPNKVIFSEEVTNYIHYNKKKSLGTRSDKLNLVVERNIFN